MRVPKSRQGSGQTKPPLRRSVPKRSKEQPESDTNGRCKNAVTQATVVFCLATAHTALIPLIVLIVVKEILMLIGALLVMRDKNVETPYARWWGKLATVMLYALMIVVIIGDYVGHMPSIVITFISSVAIAFVFFSFLSYLTIYFKKEK